MRRTLVGSAVGFALVCGLAVAMVPLRSHLSIATAALVFVVPVVVGVIIGGFAAGVTSVVAGFVAYDYGFVPPFDRLSVETRQDWVALLVYVVVMVLVSRVVDHLDTARFEAQRRAVEAQRLLELSELLVDDRSVEELLRTIVRTVGTVFDVAAVALLVPVGEQLEIVASEGEQLTEEELGRLDPRSGIPVSLGTVAGAPDAVHTVALTASGRPVGMLAMRGTPASEADRSLLRIFANHAALALERAQLREQALRTELLEEVDRLRHALMGAVSHDLRTPLATMKVASSTLMNPATPLSDEDARELHGLIDMETDRLTRLVTSLLDMTRIDAGVLEIRRTPRPVDDMVMETVATVRSALGERRVDVVLPASLPDVDIDQLLVSQVLANLLDNADRHAPAGTAITVSAELCDGNVVLSVSDRGTGVPPAERDAVFDRFVRFDTGGRAGLGLTIAKTFVEAHGQRIWVEDAPDGGARFLFTLPLASCVTPAEVR